MKRKGLAFVLAAAMVLTCVPANPLVGFAEELPVEEALVVEENAETLDTTEAASVEADVQVSDQVPAPEETAISPEAESDQIEEIAEEIPTEASEPSEITSEDSVLEDDDTEELLLPETDAFLEEVEVAEVEAAAETLELAAEETDITEMVVNTPYNVEKKVSERFEFTPDKSGIYTFESAGDIDVVGELYDESDNPLSENDDGGAGLNFKVVYSLTAGTTYYLVARTYDREMDAEEVSFSVSVRAAGILVSRITNSDFSDLDPGSIVRMAVKAEGNGKLSYAWYKNDDTVIPGANSSELSISAADGYAEYECRVTDEYGEKGSAYFWVAVKQALTVEANEYSVVAPAGTQKDLIPKASTGAAYGSLSYEWYSYANSEEEKFEGTASTLRVTVSSRKTYYCIVKDKYHSERVYFYVSPSGAGGSLSAGTGTVNVSTPGASSVYSFVAQKSGEYTVNISSGINSPYAALYNGTGETMDMSSYSDLENGVYITRLYVNLFAGDTYYLAVGFNDSSKTGTCNVTMTLEHEHSYKVISRVEPTCTTGGSATYKCTYVFQDEDGNYPCNSEHKQSLPALGHSYGAYTVTTPATVLAAGVMTRTCTRCGAKQTAPIAKLTPTISVNVKSIPLKVKQSTTKVKVTMGTGDYITSWKSNKPKIAKVSSSGKITGVKAGTAKITVTLASGVSKTITVKVQKTKVKTKKITNVSKKVTLKKGAKYTLAPSITPITTLEKVKYSTANKKIATVSKKGVITAKKKGKVKITVKCGTKKKTITVTVK